MAIYRHFKGGVYATYGIAHPVGNIDTSSMEKVFITHTEKDNIITVFLGDNQMYCNEDEDIVVYRSVSKLKQCIWGRPISSFNSNVVTEEGIKPRFEKLLDLA